MYSIENIIEVLYMYSDFGKVSTKLHIRRLSKANQSKNVLMGIIDLKITRLQKLIIILFRLAPMTL